MVWTGVSFAGSAFTLHRMHGHMRCAPNGVQPDCYKHGMQNDVVRSITQLSDAELVTRVKSLVSRERDATAHLVAHLAELDTRDVHLREGYSSLFVYCTDALGLSEGETGNRIEAARAARRFPVILDLLESGAVNLTAVRLLAPHLTVENHREVLASARGQKKAKVLEIVARLSPRPDAPASIRRLPTPIAHRQALFAEPAVQTAMADEPASTAPASLLMPPVAPAVARPAAVIPLSPDRYKFQLTIGGDTLEKLRLAKDMLSHAVPSGDDTAILDRALDALLEDLARHKFAHTTKPRWSRGPSDPSDISAEVQRIVWVRDRGRCTYVGPDGHRCNERRFVQFHHLVPRALHGEATANQITLRCRAHNDYDGRLWFGKRRRHDGAVGARAEHVPEHVEGRGGIPPKRDTCQPSSAPLLTTT